MSSRTAYVSDSGTRWLYVYTVQFIVSYHLSSVRFMYVWQDQILVRPKQWCIRTIWNLEATSEPGNRYSFYFLMGVGVGKLSAWLDPKLTLQTKNLSLVQVALYVTWKLADKSLKFLTFEVANFR